MQRIVIRGGYALQGRVDVSGAKNAALPLMAAALLTDAPCDITNVPDLSDIRTFSTQLQQLGMHIETLGSGKMRGRTRLRSKVSRRCSLFTMPLSRIALRRGRSLSRQR